jgi:hypothetical protein
MVTRLLAPLPPLYLGRPLRGRARLGPILQNHDIWPDASRHGLTGVTCVSVIWYGLFLCAAHPLIGGADGLLAAILAD